MRSMGRDGNHVDKVITVMFGEILILAAINQYTYQEFYEVSFVMYRSSKNLDFIALYKNGEFYSNGTMCILSNFLIEN